MNLRPLLLIPCLALGFCQSINFKQQAKDWKENIPYFEITLYRHEW